MHRAPEDPLVPIRRAGPADAAAMADLAQRAYAPYLDRMEMRPGPMDADYVLAVEQDECWVVDGPDGAMIAMIVLCPTTDHLLLDNVAVDPGHQGRGTGRALMLVAEERARALGLDEVRLYTHVTMVENQRIYETHGYVETHRDADGRAARVYYAKRVGGRPQTG
ncbi:MULTISPECIES: GNAT family N-acetyltransferase [unclassified Nocardioides]|uniref:GNAT family N-acetyltransferase n=1 Tax=unclassified Nocardioides TaxID=2615069 RepID=UPI003610D248